jgi:uncharacterized protein (DUF1330 family)
MAGYVILDVEVTDPATYAGYRDLATETLARYGGKFLVRGGAAESLEGGWQPHRIVVLEFESVAAARRWYDSPEYAEAKSIRFAASRSKAIVVEGV